MTRNILLVTNIWNERQRIPSLFKAVGEQTVLPMLWVWFDDGSTDNSVGLIEEIAKNYQVPVKIFQMPQKTKGNLDTIGRAYHRFMPQLYHLDFDYMVVLDVDSHPYSDFFETQCRLLEANPDAGISGGQVPCDPLRTSGIMGLGMFIRGDFVRRIKRWWDFSPDSMFNILAIFAGFTRLLVNDLFIPAACSAIFQNPKIGFRFGRYAVIVEISFLRVLRKFQGRLRNYGIRDAVYYIAGYLFELTRPYRMNYKEMTLGLSGQIKHGYLRSETLAEALCS